MSYREQLQRFLPMYQKEKGEGAIFTARDVAAWAFEKKLWEPRRVDVVDQLAEELARAWREEYRTDSKGRRYRAKHAVVLGRGSQEQGTLWADIDNAPRGHMQRAFAQRRQQIVGDCYQLKTDADVYSDKNPQSDPIQPVLDFTKDVAELQQKDQDWKDAA